MSGHSKWSGIKHKKAVVDAKRGKVFSKVNKEITVAARIGGGDSSTNPRLRMAIMKARAANMPKDNVEKAIKRGTGDIPGIIYEEVIMEGYGPGGVAIYIEALTDNKNRTAAELRSLLTKHGGNTAGAGSVSWQFQKKGVFTINAQTIDEDKLMEIVLDAGAEDLKVEGQEAIVITVPKNFDVVKRALDQAKISTETAELSMVPSSTIRVDDVTKIKVLLNLLDLHEDHDDVQHVYANFDIPETILEAQAAKS